MEEPLLIPNISRTQPMTSNPNPNPDPSNPKANPNNSPPLRCPRCDSSNTKFCYYNNYSLAQPRHFCKSCKRYWTRGGTLRNVPVGGGCRKNKRTKKQPSNNSISISTAKLDPNNFLSTSLNQMFQHNSTPFDGNGNITFSNGMVTTNTTSGFDLQNQVGSFGFLGQNNPFQHMQQNGGIDEYPILGTSLFSKFPFEEIQAMNGGNFGASKDLKGEKESKTWQIPFENFMDPNGSNGVEANQINSNPFYYNGSVSLSDSANYGSSVPPLF